MSARDPRVLAIDAGGTMTDTFVVDRDGDFVVGKAQSTPEDESVGFMASTKDAFDYWDLAVEDGMPGLASGIYSGTAMLNRLLERKGRRVGVIVTGGMEDMLRLERGIQTYLGYSYSDRLHVATHHHNEPLVPRDLVKGVRERVDMFGEVAIPLYEDEARTAVQELRDARVEGLVVCLLYGYRNSEHEDRIREIAEELAPEIPVFLASELYPMRRDFPRLNSTVIEAYAAEPSREQLQKVRDATRSAGAGFDLRVMAAHGGTISIEARQLARTLISGPIGGVIGAKHLVDQLAEADAGAGANVVCTDIGGTSFDIALITDGDFQIRPIPDIGRFLLNLPLVQVDSIGAGTGSFVRIDPNSGRPELGPDSAGAKIGVCWTEGGLETPTVTDLNLILGRINPDYFLGGDVKLDAEAARAAISEQIAAPLGLTPEHAAAGVIELFDQTLAYQAVAQVLGKGYSPVDYTLLCYGGGGPLHVAGYSADIPYRDVLVPAWAAGFSAFGCACGDYAYRYDLTLDMPITPIADLDEKAGIGMMVDGGWLMLRERVAAEFAKSGVEEEEIEYRHFVRMQYYGQLNDLEILSPHQSLESGEQVDDLIEAFEEAYGKLYARAARSPELGYLITNVIVTGSVPVEKPALPDEPEVDGAPEPKATRPVWWTDGWTDTPIYEQGDVRAGQTVAGPAVIESPADTFAIPPGRSARLDRHRIFHLGQL
ncbi:MAG: acetone carboxylase, beta subunit [Solirubrobacteraceae bacterium]|jgi:N-methylhydantoinase A/acetone carboxylase beta subunit|nr:acetone carboxylase, beta subunit [Solirubrobacteraceae bacterium]MDX6672452.1 acetone carboxylase, beta subunit [Solirubrobacteraceae bacterium]